MWVECNYSIRWSQYRYNLKITLLLGAYNFHFIARLKWAKPDPAFRQLAINFHFNVVSLFA